MYISDHRKEHLDPMEKRTDHPEILDAQLDAVPGLHFGLSCLRRRVNVFHMWEKAQNGYLVTRRINTGRGCLSVHKLGSSSSWVHS